MTKGIRVTAGYRRAAAGVVGCFLVGGALGANPVHLGATAPVSSGESPSAPSKAVLSRAPSVAQRPSDVGAGNAATTEVGAQAPSPVPKVGRRALLADEDTSFALRAYTVQQGDSLWSISVDHDTDADTLLALNANVDPEALQPGQAIDVAQAFHGITYVVQPADTLQSIAQAHALSADAIRHANGMGRSNSVHAGELLFLPGARPRNSRPLLASRAGSRPDATAADTPSVAISARAPAPPPAPVRAAPPAPARPAPRTGWIWPLVGGLYTAEFGEPRHYGIHEGIDIAVPAGTPAVAARAGTVEFAGWRGGLGYCVLIDHGDGFKTRYAHASVLLVTTGARVNQGQPVIRVGSTGESTGPHLHFEVIVNGTARNPRAFLP